METPADKATPGFVRMLDAAAGAPARPFRFARGTDDACSLNSGMPLNGSRKSCPIAEDALWANSGRRVAALRRLAGEVQGVGEPVAPGEASLGASQMGLTEERSPLKGSVSQRHPDITYTARTGAVAYPISDLLMYRKAYRTGDDQCKITR